MRKSGLISFVGAGPGAPDLITLRGAQRLAAADVVVWAASLVPEALLEHCRREVEVFDSKAMTLEDVTAVYAAHPDAAVVRLHSGDPTVFSAVAEQAAWCVAHGRRYEIVPGVGSAAATAAAAGCELTLPGVAQSVVLTRLAARTSASVPSGGGDGVEAAAALGVTMAVYLSAARPDALRDALLCPDSAYGPETPALVAWRTSWPDERLVRTTVGGIPDALAELEATTTVLVLVGDAVGGGDPPARSHVYDPRYTHSFRDGDGG